MFINLDWGLDSIKRN